MSNPTCPDCGRTIGIDDGCCYDSRGNPVQAADSCHATQVAKLRERNTELEQRLARVAELAHDRNDDTHEWRSKRLGRCASLAWDHMEETFSLDPLKRRSTLKWAKLAKQLSDSEEALSKATLELADARRLGDVERELVEAVIKWKQASLLEGAGTLMLKTLTLVNRVLFLRAKKERNG